MSPENFCYWIRGYLELSLGKTIVEGLSAEQVKVINDHLDLVFEKQTPERKIDIKKMFEKLPKNILNDGISDKKFC